MKQDAEGRPIYIFSVDDPWIAELREIFMGPIGWDPEDFDGAWSREDGMPSMFCQLMVVYRHLEMTPMEAVQMLGEHPNYKYLKDLSPETFVTEA